MVHSSRNSNRAVISLFSGAGGLDIGLEKAGFDVRLCVEIDADARKTIRANRPSWRLSEPGDITKIKPEAILRQAGLQPGETFLLAGGPPCQPFSKAAYWANGDAARMEDARAVTLRRFVRTVQAILPKVFLLENVVGIAYRQKDEAIRYLKSSMTRINNATDSSYSFSIVRINCAHYGVPQRRERVFVIGVRDVVCLICRIRLMAMDLTRRPWSSFERLGMRSGIWTAQIPLLNLY